VELKLASATHTPLIAGADSRALEGVSRDAAWRQLRDREQIRYVGLCLPRIQFGSGWASGAYAVAAKAINLFTKHHWCAALKGTVAIPGKLESLADTDLPFEDLGLMYLREEGDAFGTATLAACPSLRIPKQFNSEAANRDAKLAAQFSFSFAGSRTVHYLQKVAHFECSCKPDTGLQKAEMEIALNRWVMDYFTNF